MIDATNAAVSVGPIDSALTWLAPLQKTRQEDAERGTHDRRIEAKSDAIGTGTEGIKHLH